MMIVDGSPVLQPAGGVYLAWAEVLQRPEFVTRVLSAAGITNNCPAWTTLTAVAKDGAVRRALGELFQMIAAEGAFGTAFATQSDAYVRERTGFGRLTTGQRAERERALLMQAVAAGMERMRQACAPVVQAVAAAPPPQRLGTAQPVNLVRTPTIGGVVGVGSYIPPIPMQTQPKSQAKVPLEVAGDPMSDAITSWHVSAMLGMAVGTLVGGGVTWAVTRPRSNPTDPLIEALTLENNRLLHRAILAQSGIRTTDRLRPLTRIDARGDARTATYAVCEAKEARDHLEQARMASWAFARQRHVDQARTAMRWARRHLSWIGR